MKRIIFTLLLSLLMTEAAFADCFLYIDDFTVTPEQIGTEIELCIKADFSARVSGWQLDMDFPEGLTPVYAELGADADITYLNSRGRTAVHTPSFFHTDNYTRLIATTSEPGYWYDDNGDLTSYGIVKWEGGSYEEMAILYVEVSADFQGGEITMYTQCASTADARGGTIRENGDNGVTFTRVCNVSGNSGPEAYACYSPANTTLTFYYDTERSNRTGTTYDLPKFDLDDYDVPDWYSDGTSSSVTRVVFNSSFANARPETTCYWFADMENLQLITGMKNYLNTSNVKDMTSMFENCHKLTSIDVSKFNTANTLGMGGMFWGCSSLTSLNVSNFNTANVEQMWCMFAECENLTSLDLSNFNTAKVENMYCMFDECNNLTSLDVSNFNTANVTDMEAMFYNCQNLTSLDLSSFNTSKVTEMDWMFAHCKYLTSLDVSSFNTSKVTDMTWMFANCLTLKSLDVSHFNTANVTDMEGMFGGCNSLTSLDVTSFNTANVTDMYDMFYGCSSLTRLDLSSFNTAKVNQMGYMFCWCGNLVSIYVDDGWTTDAVTNDLDMFSECNSLRGDMGTTYDPNHVDKTYAHLDGGPTNPGYLSMRPEYTRGDVNDDGSVNITDVTALINYLLSHNANGVSVDAADCNLDGNVNISDVTALINYLLSHNWPNTIKAAAAMNTTPHTMSPVQFKMKERPVLGVRL